MSSLQVEEIPTPGYERVVHGTDDATGLNAFIAVHSTALGPALGGVRMWPYVSEAEALTDVTRLAKAMSYKAAVAQTGQGGGKAVVIGDPKTKAPEMMRALGRLIESLGGAYVAAEDMNMTVADLEAMGEETKHVSGRAVEHGSSGNPSPMTAVGCFIGIQRCLEEVYGDRTLKDRVVALQGAGAVGHDVVRLCREAGARVAVADIDPARVQACVENYGAEAVEPPEAILEYPCDVFSPCGRGAVLNAETIPKLRCKIVAGAANNQLAEEADGQRLQDRGILYAPDYVINAGGVINIAGEFVPGGYSAEAVRERVQTIDTALRDIFRIARDQGITPAAAADHLAEQRIAEGKSDT